MDNYKKQILQRVIDFYIEKAEVDRKTIKTVACLMNDIEAINYTHSCTELKDLDSDNFEDWLIVNGYTVYKNHYMKGDQVFFESELIQKYKDEVMNL